MPDSRGDILAIIGSAVGKGGRLVYRPSQLEAIALGNSANPSAMTIPPLMGMGSLVWRQHEGIPLTPGRHSAPDWGALSAP